MHCFGGEGHFCAIELNEGEMQNTLYIAQSTFTQVWIIMQLLYCTTIVCIVQAIHCLLKEREQ